MTRKPNLVLLGNDVLGDQNAEYTTSGQQEGDAYDPFAPGQNGDYPGASEQEQQRPGPSGLKRVLAQLGLNLSQSLGNSLYAHLSPEAFQAEQQAKRQREELDQQLRIHNTLTPYERLQVQHQKTVEQRQQQEHADAMAQQQFENQRQIAAALATHVLSPVQDPGTVSTGIQQVPSPPQAPQPQGGAPSAPMDMLAQLFNLPGKQVAPQLQQAPPIGPDVLQAGGLRGRVNPGVTEKDFVDLDPASFDPESGWGQAFKAAGITKPIKVSSDNAVKLLNDFAEKHETAEAKKAAQKEKDDQQKATMDTIQKQVEIGHNEINQRFSPAYYQGLYGGKVDPFAAQQAASLHAQLDAAAVSGKKAFSPTEVTQALKEIRTYQSPWEKLQEKQAEKSAGIAERAAARADTRSDKSYQLNIGELDKVEKPVDDAAQKFGRLNETINQRTAQADTLLAPALLSVMVGGSGSGLRMNEAEIARIIGGRDKLESLKAAVYKWTPGNGLSVTDTQRGQIQALVKAVGEKLYKKQAIYTKARQDLVNTDDVHEHRVIMQKAQKEANDIDSPSVQDQLGVNNNDPDGLRKFLPKR